MQLILDRPIAFIDIESTGTSRENDRIIEFFVTKLFPNGDRETKTRRFNPGRPIPEEATAVHGISDEDVADKPSFSQCAKALIVLLSGCDIAGFNSNAYDCPMLYNEFKRCGINWDYSDINFIDAGNIFKIQHPRDLTSAVMIYCNRDHKGAHASEDDVDGTIDVLLTQVGMIEQQMTIKELAVYSNFGKPILDISGKFTYNEDGEIIFNFGPHYGKLASSERGFLDWMLNKKEGNKNVFSEDSLMICRQILKTI